MPDQWIIRVNDKEYGPADVETLRDWKADGRVLPTNDTRRPDSEVWEKASGIPGLFEPEPPPVQPPPLPRFRTEVANRSILPETFAIYVRGFFKYLGLVLLVAGPGMAAQLISI